jgi:hypothetical protein
MIKLDLGPMQRALLEDLRALSSDADGREVLVGLTYDETLAFQALSKAEAANYLASRQTPLKDEDRWLRLQVRHSKARLEVAMAEHEAWFTKPTLN